MQHSLSMYTEHRAKGRDIHMLQSKVIPCWDATSDRSPQEMLNFWRDFQIPKAILETKVVASSFIKVIQH